MDRRTALNRLVSLPLAAALPAALAGCDSGPKCNDTSGLSPDDVKIRTETAAYVEMSPDAAKRCDACAQWVPGPSAKDCGSCKVVKGPINPAGTCKLFAPRS